MSDIGMPPGFTLFVISIFAGTFCVAIMLLLLLINFFIQRELNFARRLPFRLLMGTMLPLIFAILGAVLADSMPHEWRVASEHYPEWAYIAFYIVSLNVGWLIARRL